MHCQARTRAAEYSDGMVDKAISDVVGRVLEGARSKISGNTDHFLYDILEGPELCVKKKFVVEVKENLSTDGLGMFEEPFSIVVRNLESRIELQMARILMKAAEKKAEQAVEDVLGVKYR